MSKGERDDFISKIKRTTEMVMNTDIMKEKNKGGGYEIGEKKTKKKQYANISKGLKKKFSNFSEVEMIEFRERQKKNYVKPRSERKTEPKLKEQ